MAPIVVTGLKTGIPPHPQESDYPARLDWNTFARSRYNVTLFAKALEIMEAMSQSIDVPLGFFQLSGIICLSETDNPNRQEFMASPQLPGTALPSLIQTCISIAPTEVSPFPAALPVHVLIAVPTFPTWHRPYVALYEQTLASHFPEIIRHYRGRVRVGLQEAARTWRLPYWEWAVDHPTLPFEFTTQTIQIFGTSGRLVDLDPNPFAYYAFKPIDPSFTGVFATFPKSLRCPSTSSANAVSRPAVANSLLQSKNLKRNTWGIFEDTNRDAPWDSFSNESARTAKSLGPMNSLESVHGSVHVSVGGNNPAPGHMSVVPVAAFDPIFWMHHCQVERLLTLWMAIYYQSKVPDTDPQLQKKLDPFRKSATQMVTSNDIQSTLTYGYIYPEIKAHPNTTPAQLSRLVYQDVERLYGGSSIFSAFKAGSDDHALTKTMEALAQNLQEATVMPSVSQNVIRLAKPNPASYELTPDTYREWIVNVTLDKYALGGSGSVMFFFCHEDAIPEDSNEWHTSPIYVGSYDIFAYTNPDECANCKELQDAGMKVGGTVYLTEPLIRRQIALTGDEPLNYLKEKLCWRCHGLGGTVVRNEDIPSLEVVVQSAGYRVVPGQDRPQRTRWQIHEEVTRGKVGGIKEDEEA